MRICNYCGHKLEHGKLELNEHLRLIHGKIWQKYSSLLGELVNRASRCQKKSQVFPKLVCSSDEDDDSEDETKDDGNLYNVVDSLQHSSRPVLTAFERKIKRTYTYDKQRFKEFSDYDVISYCNYFRKGRIQEIISSSNSLSPNSLYGKSNVVNSIARLLCEKGCYNLPSLCLLDDEHTYDYKELMKKDLHDRFSPEFKHLLCSDKDKRVRLEVDGNNHPKLSELCEEIGFTTDLIYDSHGYLDINYDVICREMWDYETPLYVLQEKKVLDVILLLLLSSSDMRKENNKNAALSYRQELPGLNKPLLATMCHGPDYLNTNNKQEECSLLEADEEETPYKKDGVVHKFCRNYKKEDHWKFHHNSEDKTYLKDDDNIEGPVTTTNQTIAYPCNKGHRHCCTCKLCSTVKIYKCKNHKEHMTYNLKKCLVQKAAQCQSHWIDHPDNMTDEDIIFRRHIIFHNGELVKHGRNYHFSEVILAGLKRACMRCRSDVEEHFLKHLVFHPQCKICLYESKTVDDENFWKFVCSMCGKRFDTEYLKHVHMEKHNVPRNECVHCPETFASKFNFHRHLIEQHNSFQEDNNGLIDGSEEEKGFHYVCKECGKECKYYRNAVAHIAQFHEKKDLCSCRICGKAISYSSNLKSHYKEVHGVLDLGREICRETYQIHECRVCEKKFKRKSHLTIHLTTHNQERTNYPCPECNNSFVSIHTLKRHKRIHIETQNLHKCQNCPKQFKLERYLKEHMKVHADRETYSCDFCMKSFYSKKHLKRHVDTHNQNRYYCQNCGQDFSRKDNLNRHNRKYH